MQQRSFARSRLALGVALAVGSAVLAPAPVTAQTAEKPAAEAKKKDEAPLEEIVVTGIRMSLKRSMDLKREADGVLDAISAEDIGKFPDTNLAESLQRVTGVSIDRSRGEGSKVTVRGFGPDFNLVTLNGRQMPTASGTSRSFDFGNLASEGIAGVEIYKSGKADVPTGGIGSTINIKTTRPLEAPGMKASVGIKGVHDTSTESGDNVTPEVSGIFSNTFANDTIGVALSASYQDRDNGSDQASVGGWRSFPGQTDNCWCGAGPSEWGGIPPAGDPNQQNRPGEGDIYSVPQSIGYELAEYNRKRTNGQLTLQWKPIESVTATLDYTYSEVELKRSYNNLSAWFNFGAQQTLWTDGPNASPLVYTENLPGDYSMGAGEDAWRTENGSTGFNLEWQATEKLKLAVDYHDSDAEFRPDSPFGDSALISMASFTRVKTTGYFDTDLPVLELGLSGPLNPDDMIVTGSVFTNNLSKMDIKQSKFSGTFDFDENPVVESIDFGIQLTEVNNRSAGSVVQRDAWGGVTQRGAISDLLTPSSMAGDFDQFGSGGDARRQADYFTYSMKDIIARTEQLMASGAATTFYTADMGDCGTGLCSSSIYGSDRRTVEESDAAYFQINHSSEWGNMQVHARLGLRYEQTDVDSEALSPTYTRIDWVGGNEFSAARAVDANGKLVQDFTQLGGDYDMWLPNFDFSIGLTDDVVARASLSKTMTRPNYGDIQGGLTIAPLLRVDGGTGSRGNPNLQPFESKNIDLSLEWYYGDDSYVSVGWFHKDVENFIGTSSVREGLFDLPHPAQGSLWDRASAATGSTDSGTLYRYILDNFPTEPGVNAAAGTITGIAGRDDPATFNLTIPINIEKATMKGWEFNVQHSFGETGFGVIANATLVDADVGYDDMNLTQQFVLTGLSDSYNFIAFYDKNGIQVRIAYNWRDHFLAGTGQNNVGSGPPTYVDDYGQWDANASYTINDNLTVFVEGINLTDETTHVYGRTEMQTLFAVQTGPRYAAGLRYTF